MGRRRKARELLIQSLYASEVGAKSLEDAVAEQIERRNPTDNTIEYVRLIIRAMAEHGGVLDGRINGALTGWSPERVGAVERAILRLALLEILFVEEVPPKVAISEAVDLAKTFSTDDSSRFINGVLDTIFNENEKVS